MNLVFVNLPDRRNPRSDRSIMSRQQAQSLSSGILNENPELRQVCCVCGKPAHAHHEDYSKPLMVVFLCPLHHALRHREIVSKATAYRYELELRIGTSMRAARKASGKTGSEVAATMGISAPYLSDMELGRRAWSSETITKFNTALKSK